jgi:fatty acid desaturase
MSTEPRQAYEVLIDDTLYDTRGFKHPGGSVIKFLTGTGDATEAFLEFHGRSVKAQKMLKALPSRRAPPIHYEDAAAAREAERHAAMSKDFVAMHRRLAAEGWFDASPAHCVYRVVEIVAIAALGAYIVATGVLPAIFGLALMGIASGRCGWLMHEAGHLSMTTNIKYDIKLQEMIYGIGCGMSGGWWRSQHNKHHCTPQKLKHDVDLDTLPFIAFHERIAVKAGKSAFTRFWIPLQAFLFAPVTCLIVTLSWQLFLHPRYIYRTKKVREAFWLAVRWAALFAFKAAIGATMGRFIAAYVLANVFGGTYIFLNFALSHTHLDIVEADANPHWIEYAAKHTTNLSGPFVDWWMGYLNYQIEHHLFPSMPQYRFPRLAPQVKALFERHGLKYDVRSYAQGMYDTFANMNTVAKTVSAPKAKSL